MDPLDKLIVSDAVEVDRNLLANITYPRARLYGGNGSYQIRFTPEGEKLKLREKILTYLCALKALSLKDTEGKISDSAGPAEIEKATGIGSASLRPVLRKLVNEHLLVQQEGKRGAYSVPNYALNAVSKILPPTLQED